MIKKMKNRMANILNCRAIYLKPVGKIIEKPSTKSIGALFQSKKIEKVKGSNIESV